MAERVVAFAGSLRRDSFNRALILAAQELAPAGLSIEAIEIGELPFYNADIESAGDPPSVAAFKAAVQRADGLLDSAGACGGRSRVSPPVTPTYAITDALRR